MKKPKHSWKDYAKQLYIRYKDDDISALGAQLTFYLLMSMFPFLLFVLNILPLTPLSSADFIRNTSSFLPGEISDFIGGIIENIQLAGDNDLLPISALFLTIWSASRGIHSISLGLNKAYDTKENRPFWKVIGMTLMFTISLVFIMLAVLLFLVFGGIIGSKLFAAIDGAKAFLKLWEVLRYVAPVVILFFGFTLLYRYIPNCCLDFRETLPGSIFCTFGWILISHLFSIYVDNFTNYENVYGGIGGIIILLIWLHISSNLILFGGEINATFAYYRSNSKIDKYENAKLTIPLIAKLLEKKPPK